jgi:hypothetical protein
LEAQKRVDKVKSALIESIPKAEQAIPLNDYVLAEFPIEGCILNKDFGGKSFVGDLTIPIQKFRELYFSKKSSLVVDNRDNTTDGGWVRGGIYNGFVRVRVSGEIKASHKINCYSYTTGLQSSTGTLYIKLGDGLKDIHPISTEHEFKVNGPISFILYKHSDETLTGNLNLTIETNYKR